MALFFIDAVPGTGKTSLIKELRNRGEDAHDTDDECVMRSKSTGKVIEHRDRKNVPHNWVYPVEKIKELKEASRYNNVFLSGSIDNYEDVRPAVDYYVWMDIPLGELLRRLAERHNDFGESDSEREYIINLHKDMEEMGHPKAFKIDATKSTKQIADELVEYANSLD